MPPNPGSVTDGNLMKSMQTSDREKTHCELAQFTSATSANRAVATARVLPMPTNTKTYKSPLYEKIGCSESKTTAKTHREKPGDQVINPPTKSNPAIIAANTHHTQVTVNSPFHPLGHRTTTRLMTTCLPKLCIGALGLSQSPEAHELAPNNALSTLPRDNHPKPHYTSTTSLVEP